MDTSLKQRLMGALVLISLAVIFLPLVFDGQQERIRTEQYAYQVRGRDITGSNYKESLSRLQIPKIGMPRDADWGELLTAPEQP